MKAGWFISQADATPQPLINIWAWFMARYPAGTEVGYERRNDKTLMLYARLDGMWQLVEQIADGEGWVDELWPISPREGCQEVSREVYGTLLAGIDNFSEGPIAG